MRADILFIAQFYSDYKAKAHFINGSYKNLRDKASLLRYIMLNQLKILLQIYNQHDTICRQGTPRQSA